ncbi:hypothetical protein [Leptospira perolatii]|uniref:hypothetical protein n=1 Tax=Leptospira perolatii TaxID=2023191 RepID=UPI001FAE9377|nr:hypothetical protein [Leptospira perolatii]
MEKIKFNPVENTFVKTYVREVIDGNKFRRINLEGRGSYEVQGNWILLSTSEIETTEENWKFGETSKFSTKTMKSSSHRLLYHFDPLSDSIIPMLYETGYDEKPFGVVEGTRIPYSENEAFQISRKNYASKEYQSHVYTRIR